MSKKITAKAISYAAMLTAMSVIIGIFCKNFMNFGGGLFRVTFENLPIILSGICFGPMIGALVGIATDLVSYLLSSQIYPPNLIVTLGAASVGAVSGIVSHLLIKKQGYLQIVLSGAFAHLIGSVIIKSIGLYTFYGMAILWRIPLYAVVASVEIALICLLYKNNNFKNILSGFNSSGRQP